MQSITFLIKPASGSCNMACSYCFYADEVSKRETALYGFMSDSTRRHLIRYACSAGASQITFCFQGGEPTLIGLDFYRKFVQEVNEIKAKNVQVSYAIQTNGLLLDAEWADFFRENHFLVGISLDGTKEIHDFYRKDTHGRDTFSRIASSIRLLKNKQVEFNILTVVTDRLARSPQKVYNFFKKQDLRFLQFIPCISPFEDGAAGAPAALTAEKYGEFLKGLFDLWYRDIKNNDYTSIRVFDNYIWKLRGYPAAQCGMNGVCSIQNVVEADGSLYVCDFYVIDKYKFGNVCTDSYETAEENRRKTGFIESSVKEETECLSCPYRRLCCGGCRRDRDTGMGGDLTLNRWCLSYRMFFDYALDRLLEISRLLH